MTLDRRSILATRLSELRRQERGVEAIPGVAVVYVGLFVVIFTAIQIAFFFIAQNTADAAAESGYQQARAFSSTDQAGIDSAKGILAENATVLGNTSVTVTRTATTVTVTVEGDSISFIPGLVLRVAQAQTGPIERWVP